MLSQEQEKGEVVIAYASKHLKPPQLKYATIEKEAYAVIFAIKHFHHYLVGRPFTVISDHRPLQWLAQQKDDSGRLGRWAVKLAAYDYRIVYRPGRVHQNADSLSRLRVAAAQNGTVDGAERHLMAAVDSLTIDSNLGDLQRADKLCKSIINYLQHGTRAVEDIQITPLWLKEIDFYNIENGILYRRAPNLKSKRRNEENRQLVLPLALRRRVVKELHDAATAGHLAFIRTYTKVSDHYYWPDMRKDIKKYCETCEVCIANSKLNIKSPLHPIEQATRPFQIIGIDFLGPIKPCSSSGNSHIMVMTDYFSKWAEAVALPNQTAAVTADCLYSTIIQRHGPPEVIITDQGRNFVSKLFNELCVKFNIKHRTTTAYHPANNGETERFNRTLISMLRKVLQDGNHANWDKMLGDVMFAYRSSVHSTTLETPYYILHGRDPNFSINNLLLSTENHSVSASDHIGNLLERLRFCFHKVREENEYARKRQKEQYDKKAQVRNFDIGDNVLLDVRVVKTGDCKKFTSNYRGPFRIIKTYDN